MRYWYAGPGGEVAVIQWPEFGRTSFLRCEDCVAGLQVRRKKYSSLSMPAPPIAGVVWRDASVPLHVHPRLPAIRQSNLP